MPNALSIKHVMLAAIGLVSLIISFATIFSTRHIPHQLGSSSALGKALLSSQTAATTKPLNEPLVEENPLLKKLGPSSALGKALPSSQTAATMKPLSEPLVEENPLLKKKPFPGSKAVIAYAISITSCPVNTTTVFDGPAILSHSIHQVSIRKNSSLSKYDYGLYAFIHPKATNCSHLLEFLGYEVLIRDIPFSLDDIQTESYKKQIEEDGCCGSREFLKLWAYTLSDHDIVVHTDTDVMFLQPLDKVFDAMLDSDTSKHSLATMGGAPLPSKIDFVYTRDYLQRSRITRDPMKFGVQGGFFVVRPDPQIFDEIKQTILRGDYERGSGWAKLKYGGYWGAPQIQGFLSYFYGEVHPEHAVELNRCLYNTMVDDPPEADGKCRTGEKTCEDCRETPLSEMITVHLTTCWKPWHVSTLNKLPISLSQPSFTNISYC